MDPFTITSSVLRITGSCVGAAHTLWEIRKAWKRAPVTVGTLCSQLKLTAASLSQIQSLLLGEADVLQDKPDLVVTFDTTLTSCLVLSSWLEKYMLKIKKGALEGSKTTWKTKFKMVWNEGDVRELLAQLQTQQTAISMLVGLLQVDSMSEIRKLVREHHALLQEIANNTLNTRRTHAPDAPASILGADDTDESIFSQLIDSKEADDTGFESVILNSKVYSSAFTGVLQPNTHDDETDDARTIIENEPASPIIVTVERGPRVVQSAAQDHGLAIHDPAIRSPVRNLGVTETQAYAVSDYTACSDEELSLKKSEVIENLKHLTRARYCGTYKGGSERWGQFDRHRVVVQFALQSPLQMHTTKASSRRLGGVFLAYEEGEVLQVRVFAHDIIWATRCKRHNGSENEEWKHVFICDLKLEEAVEQDVDRLLQLFSCPLPALVSLSRYQQRSKIREIARKPDLADLLPLLAHCSTFKELQYVAAERKKAYEESL